MSTYWQKLNCELPRGFPAETWGPLPNDTRGNDTHPLAVIIAADVEYVSLTRERGWSTLEDEYARICR